MTSPTRASPGELFPQSAAKAVPQRRSSTIGPRGDERQRLLEGWTRSPNWPLDNKSFGPGQWFRVRHLSEGRCIDVAWDCEVCPEYYARYGKRRHTVFKAELQENWWRLEDTKDSLSKSVGRFHATGEWLSPCWCLHLTPDVAVL